MGSSYSTQQVLLWYTASKGQRLLHAALYNSVGFNPILRYGTLNGSEDSSCHLLGWLHVALQQEVTYDTKEPTTSIFKEEVTSTVFNSSSANNTHIHNVTILQAQNTELQLSCSHQAEVLPALAILHFIFLNKGFVFLEV
jgi:hypothetical protein